jgi:uncharacterized protein YndB with AHSA1/START domain
MTESRFLYVTYIRAPAAKIFAALTDPEQNKKFWGGYSQQSTWEKGADYSIVSADGSAWDTGKVLSIDPPRHVSVSWLHLRDAAMKAEGASTASFDLEPMGDNLTKVTLTHSIGVSPSKLIAAVSTGWPMIMASLKTLMETGEAFDIPPR